MRAARHLFPELCRPDHLATAAVATTRGKRRRPDVAWFLFRLEDELDRLRTELVTGTYQPEPFELVRIRDPKPRVITRIPIADRVVQGALVMLMEPVFLPSLTDDAFACRPGFGTHRAVLRLLALIRRHAYVLHLDVRSYFPSIDRTILRSLLDRRIRDERFLAIVDRVLESGAGLYDLEGVREAAGIAPDWPPPGCGLLRRGLPIGSATSQLFAAHVYLAGLDHHVKRVLKVPGYVRYVDDLFLFGRRRSELRPWRSEVASWLEEERHLRLKHPRARILSCLGHLDALGYRIRRQGVTALPRAIRRLQRRVHHELVGGYRKGRGRPDIERSLASSAGIVLFG